MKKLLLISFSLLIGINYSLSQAPENQWLIWNGNGKNGYSGGANTYASTSITSPYNLTGVSSPVLPNPQIPKNDLLIIYSDGQHYNSRYSTDTGVFFYGSAGSTVSNHNFNTPPGAQYLYLTNRYEGDDFPSGVRAASGTISGGTANTLGATTASQLSANHDIVFGKDITLIIKYDSILKSIQDQGDITLNFDSIQPHGGGPVSYGGNFLDLQPVFGTSLTNRAQAVYPNAPGDPGTADEIILNPAIVEPYWYVNLKPNANLSNFAPAAKGPTLWDAVFTVKKGSIPVAQIVEEIRLSHDPNFLRVESICKAPDGSHLVTYRLQFENDGEAAATSLAAEVTFPPQFDLSCFFIHKWHVGGLPCTGNISNAGSTRTFSFLNENKLLSKFFDKTKSIGYVIFTVRVNPPIDVTDVGVSLQLINPTVIMDFIPYKVDLFYDLRVCKQDAAPEGLSKSKDQTPRQNKEKKDLTEKEKGEAKSVLLSESVGGAFHCSRPITPGPCKCKDPLCLKCIVGAFAILALALLFIFRNKWKKPVPPRPPLTPNN